MDYSNLFPSASSEAIALLRQMLTFSRAEGGLRGRSQEADFGEEGVTVGVFRGDSQ